MKLAKTIIKTIWENVAATVEGSKQTISTYVLVWTSYWTVNVWVSNFRIGRIMAKKGFVCHFCILRKYVQIRCCNHFFSCCLQYFLVGKNVLAVLLEKGWRLLPSKRGFGWHAALEETGNVAAKKRGNFVCTNIPASCQYSTNKKH